MIRKIIRIDSEKCNGCGACASACHEGAIEMVNSKAVLARESYCDGLGDCLPACPTGAISFEVREAPAYDEQAVKAAQKGINRPHMACPGSRSVSIKREKESNPDSAESPSLLSQWPVQIKLVPVSAPYLSGCDLLVSADCCAYAYGNFHREFIDGRVTLIGCPKLDDTDYSEKLGEIIARNNIKSVTVVRMEVPCCGSIERAVKSAIENSSKNIDCRVVTVSTDGRIL